MVSRPRGASTSASVSRRAGRQPWLRLLLALLVASSELRAAAVGGVGPRPVVEIFGRQLFVDGKPFHLKGVNWNPVRRGGRNPQDLDFRGFVEVDAEIMSLAGVNCVRTYDAIVDADVLDALWSRNIFVLNSVYVNAEQPVESLIPKVRAAAGHPAVLMWVVGNEWNYNGFYQNLDFHASRRLLKDAARLVRSEDSTRPIATVYGSLPDRETLAAIGDDIDVWGVNQYEKKSFGPLFRRWGDLPVSKPMFVGEYGADAFNALEGRTDEGAQAEATRSLTEEIISNTSQHEGGVCIGGFVFEFADEWWKSGHPGTHDVDGADGSVHGSIYPDETFNEEWWGLVAYDGTQRAAFRAFAEVSSPACAFGSRLPGCGRDPPRATGGERLRACGAHEACAGRLGLCCPDEEALRHSCCPPPEAAAAASTTTAAASHGREEVAADDEEEEDGGRGGGKGRRPGSQGGGGRLARNETSSLRGGRRRRPWRAEQRGGEEAEEQRGAAHEGEGATPGASEEQWTCNAGFYFQFAGARSWPTEKRRWCCEHKGVACPEEEQGEGRHEMHLAKKFEILKFWRWIPRLPDRLAGPLTLLLAGVVTVAILGLAQALVVRPAVGATLRRRRQVCYGELETEIQGAEEDLGDRRCLAPISLTRQPCPETSEVLVT